MAVFNFISYSILFSHRLHKAHGTSVRFMLSQLKTDTHLTLRNQSNCTCFSTHLFLLMFHTPIPNLTHTRRRYNSQKIIFTSSLYTRIHYCSTINSSSIISSSSSSSRSSSSSSTNTNNNNNSLFACWMSNLMVNYKDSASTRRQWQTKKRKQQS